jgi:hypothetical protein
MLKDRFIHDTLGIPIQTLQNWKKSEGHNFLLYQYLVNQDKEKLKKDVQKIIDYHDYVLKTPEECSLLVEQNWEKFPQFDGYKPEETTDIKIGDDKLVTTIAFSKPDSSKHLNLLVIRYAYALSRRKEVGLKEIESIVNAASQPHINPKTVKIVYVTTSGTAPTYFAKAECEVLLLTYTELYRIISDDKILIV